MKKILFSGVAAATLACSLTSCIKTSEPENRLSTKVPTGVLISTAGSSTATVSSSVFDFNFDLVKGTAAVGTNIVVSSTDAIKFTTDEIKYSQSYWDFENARHEVISVDGSNVGKTTDGKLVNSFKCSLNSMAYIPPQLEGVPEPTLPLCNIGGNVYYKYVDASFKVGDNTMVRTFWPDATFRGDTECNYTDRTTGQAKTFKGNSAQYRVIMDLKKNTASVVIYNAKFAENMPEIKGIVMANLPLKFDASGYSVVGNDSVPYVVEGGKLVSNPAYKMTEFTFASSGDLTKGNCSFTIRGGFNCNFSGKYLNVPTTAK